jgi:serine/threonine-protein kinase
MATKEEMLFAAQAVRRHLLDREQVQEALDIQRTLDEQGRTVELAKILVKKGMMTREDFVLLRRALAASPGTEVCLDQVPGFQITGQIGAGGMANVYVARREEDDVELALKVLFPATARNPRFVDQFLREARKLTELEHDNIVRGQDFGYTGSRYYLAMELVQGHTVEDLLEERQRLPASYACYVISRVARALQYLSGRNLVHRDIKPGNILVGGAGEVKIIDLGFVKDIGGEDGEDEVTCGTVQYISPEQARGAADLDTRADIYSLGATLYHMVVGEVPFTGEDSYEVMAKQVQEGLSQAVKQHGVPKHIHYFIEKMMAKDRELRFQSPGELIDEFEGLLTSMDEIDPGSVVPPSRSAVAFAAGGQEAGEDNAAVFLDGDDDDLPVLKPAAPPQRSRARRRPGARRGTRRPR